MLHCGNIDAADLDKVTVVEPPIEWRKSCVNLCEQEKDYPALRLRDILLIH